MAALMDVADAAVAAIRTWFPRGAVKTCETHPGTFDEEELRRLATATPAVYVAIDGTRGNANASEEDAFDGASDAPLASANTGLKSPARRDVEVSFMAMVIARGEGRGRDAGRIAEAIATEMLRRVPEQAWGRAGVQGAREVSARNLFDEGLAERRMTIWNVRWLQTVRIGNPWPTDGRIPTDLCISVNDAAPVPLEVPPR